MSLLKDLLDVVGIFLEHWVVFILFVNQSRYNLLSTWLWTEVPFNFGVLELIFYLINVDLSVCALMRAYIHNSHRSLNRHWRCHALPVFVYQNLVLHLRLRTKSLALDGLLLGLDGLEVPGGWENDVLLISLSHFA